MGRILLIGVEAETSSRLQAHPELAASAFETARGEADALRRLRKSAFDVAIISPGTTLDEDLAVAEEIRRIRPGVRLILLAPSATPEAVIKALRASIFACFAA